MLSKPGRPSHQKLTYRYRAKESPVRDGCFETSKEQLASQTLQRAKLTRQLGNVRVRDIHPSQGSWMLKFPPH
jgi:hypothetical protein